MLEGLEISEISLSQVLYTETFRVDSEYFSKENIAIENLIVTQPKRFSKFEDLNIGVDCSAFYPALEPYYNTGDFPFIRVGDVKEVVNYDDCIKIPKSILPDYPTLKCVKKGDIVLTKGGSIGLVGYITKNACVSRDLIFINSSYLEEHRSIILYLYLSTQFAYKQFVRTSSQCAQPHLTTTLIKNFDICNFSNNFTTVVSKMYLESSQKYVMAKNEYVDAEALFLGEFGLNDWQPTNETTTEKNFTDFLHSGRLDAEYYQPKYDELFEHLSKYETKKLGEIAVISKSIEPGSDAYQSEGVPFVRVSNLSKYGLSQPDIYLDALEYGREVIRPHKDTILLSKDGSVGIAYKVQEDMNSITSGAILHLNLRDDEFLPDYVTLVLNSIIVKMQAERDAGGSIIQHWKPSEIEQVIIPKLSIAKQREITIKIQESFALRAESKRLLDLAKRAVEVAIEQGEDYGLKLLK